MLRRFFCLHQKALPAGSLRFPVQQRQDPGIRNTAFLNK